MKPNLAVAIVSDNDVAVSNQAANVQYWQSKSRATVEDPGGATRLALI